MKKHAFVLFLGRPAHAKSAQMDGQMDRYRRLHTDVKTYTSLQPIERATAQIQIQIFIFLEAKKIRLSFLQAWRDNLSRFLKSAGDDMFRVNGWVQKN